MKDTDLKHLTLKTTLLLALASGKHRSIIYAWVANKVSNLGQWEKVALFPSSDFISKNQLAREGSQSVSLVTIPALSDIRPATLSSWLKQTILLCYKQADQQALDLVQVKTHEFRAFAASKAFYGVVQIMQACH